MAIKKKSVTSDSPTWKYVLTFAHEMEGKLALNRHKGDREGWLKMQPGDLFDMLQREVQELADALNEVPEVPEDIAKECADIANFAMMIHDWYTSRIIGKAS